MLQSRTHLVMSQLLWLQQKDWNSTVMRRGTGSTTWCPAWHSDSVWLSVCGLWMISDTSLNEKDTKNDGEERPDSSYTQTPSRGNLALSSYNVGHTIPRKRKLLNPKRGGKGRMAKKKKGREYWSRTGVGCSLRVRTPEKYLKEQPINSAQSNLLCILYSWWAMLSLSAGFCREKKVN